MMMNFKLEDHIPTDFNTQSKVWIYQSSRVFLLKEVFEIETILNDFVKNWTSHGSKVKGFANLFFGRFIIFMADESETTVGGCSTDSSVRLIKELELKFNTEFFNRQLLTFYKNEKVEQIPLSQFAYAYKNNLIDGNTLYFNNTVTNKKDLLQSWITPIKNTWLYDKATAG